MICDRCKKRIYGYLCDGCIHDQGKKDLFEPMTNGDRIRAMNDEEMVKDLIPMIMDVCEDGIPCDEYMMDWLQQPHREA